MAEKKYYNIRRISLMFGELPEINLVASDLAENAYSIETEDTSVIEKTATRGYARVLPFVIATLKFEVHKFSPVFDKLVELLQENYIDGSVTLTDNVKRKLTFEHPTLTGYEFGGGNDIKLVLTIKGTLITNANHD